VSFRVPAAGVDMLYGLSGCPARVERAVVRPPGRPKWGWSALVVAALAVSSILAAVALFVPGDPATFATATAPVAASVSAGPLSAATPIPSSFWGINVEATHAFGLAQADEIAQTPVHYLRFSGGDTAEWFNWTSSVITDPSTGTQFTAKTSMAQFVQSCRAVNCHAMLELPAEINEPATDAAYVAYVEHTLGFTPWYWEIGNEPSPNHWTHYNQPWSCWLTTCGTNSPTEQEYETTLSNIIKAVRSVDPSTPIVAPSMGDEYSGAFQWVTGAVSTSGPSLGSFDMHNYVAVPEPTSCFSVSTCSLGTYLGMLRTGRYTIPSVVSQADSAEAAGCASCHLPLFITETGIESHASGAFCAYTEEQPGAIFASAMMIQYLEAGVQNVMWFELNGNDCNAWYVGSNTSASPIYEAFSQLFTHLGSEALPTTVSGPAGLYAVVTAKGSNLSALVVNANASTPVTLSLSGIGFSSGTSLTEYYWPNGLSTPEQLSLSSSGQPTLEPVSAAVITGPAAKSLLDYPVAFAESGLPGGTNWSVALGGMTHWSATNTVSFQEPNGSSAFTVGPVSGYSATPASGSVTVAGAAVSVSIVFAANTGGNPLTISNFSASPSTLTLGGSTQFLVAVSGGQPSYTYVYGSLPAGCTSSNASALPCTPTSTGSFTVSVHVTDAAGASASATAPLTVLPAPTPLAATASSNVTAGTAPLEVGFQGSASGGVAPYSYHWRFGDGTSSALQNPSHKYSSPGNYTAALTVTDASGNTARSAVPISVSAGTGSLTATLQASPAHGSAPLPVQFLGTATGGAAPYNFSWSFGDGALGWGTLIAHTFVSAGDYSVQLHVTDARGDSSKLVQRIVVRPGLSVTASPSVANGTAPQPVSFSAQAGGGVAPYSFLWRFGDGSSPASGSSVQHLFLLAGNYSVTVTVLDAANDSRTVTLAFAVHPAVRVELAVGTESIAPGQTIQVNARVSGGTAPYVLTWTLNGGRISAIGDQLSWVATTVGVYEFSVNVSDLRGAYATNTTVVEVASGSAATPSASSGVFGGGAILGAPAGVWIVALLAGLIVLIAVFTTLKAVWLRRDRSPSARTGPGDPPWVSSDRDEPYGSG
jgi:PKD repeat protein